MSAPRKIAHSDVIYPFAIEGNLLQRYQDQRAVSALAWCIVPSCSPGRARPVVLVKYSLQLQQFYRIYSRELFVGRPTEKNRMCFAKRSLLGGFNIVRSNSATW